MLPTNQISHKYKPPIDFSRILPEYLEPLSLIKATNCFNHCEKLAEPQHLGGAHRFLAFAIATGVTSSKKWSSLGFQVPRAQKHLGLRAGKMRLESAGICHEKVPLQEWDFGEPHQTNPGRGINIATSNIIKSLSNLTFFSYLHPGASGNSNAPDCCWFQSRAKQKHERWQRVSPCQRSGRALSSSTR